MHAACREIATMSESTCEETSNSSSDMMSESSGSANKRIAIFDGIMHSYNEEINEAAMPRKAYHAKLEVAYAKRKVFL